MWENGVYGVPSLWVTLGFPLVLSICVGFIESIEILFDHSGPVVKMYALVIKSLCGSGGSKIHGTVRPLQYVGSSFTSTIASVGSFGKDGLRCVPPHFGGLGDRGGGTHCSFPITNSQYVRFGS
jgi:hypothetical protein